MKNILYKHLFEHLCLEADEEEEPDEAGDEENEG